MFIGIVQNKRNLILFISNKYNTMYIHYYLFIKVRRQVKKKVGKP